ncbi:MAG: helix-turn-helix domain-containing protein [Chloroflexota bacterium]
MMLFIDGGWFLLVRNDPNVNRFAEIQQTLIDLLLNDTPLDELVNALGQAIGQAVLVVNMAGVVLAGHPVANLEARLVKFISSWSARNDPLPQRQLQLQALQFDLNLIPLNVQHQMIGLLVTNSDVSDQINNTLKQNSQVVTLALLKFLAAQEMASEQRNALLTDLLTGDHRPTRYLLDQAQTMGWELTSKPIAILLKFWQASHHTSGKAKSRHLSDQFQSILEQALDQYCPGSIIAPSSHGFIILPHLPEADSDPQDKVKSLLGKMTEKIDGTKMKEGYALACGGLHSGLDGLRQSYQEAQQALDIGLRLQMRRPIWFEEIYLYLLLERSGRNDEVRDWVQRTLGALAEYDRRNKTELLQTLETYFDTNQTLQEAAHTLHIHPNTLKYRLGRVEQILGQDPFKGENQLRFYLATKMARLLG